MKLTPTANTDSLIYHLEKYRVTPCYWLWLCTAVDKKMNIKNDWKIFCCGDKREQYEESIGISELLERLALDCFNNPFSTDTSTTDNNIPILDEFNDT